MSTSHRYIHCQNLSRISIRMVPATLYFERDDTGVGVDESGVSGDGQAEGLRYARDHVDDEDSVVR